MRGNGFSSRYIEKTILRLVQRDSIFQVRATVTNSNVQMLSDGISYWASLGVKFVHFEPVSLSEGLSRKQMHAEKYIDNIMLALDRAEELGVWIISSPFMNLLTPSNYFCTTVGGEKELYAPDGAISVCYQVQSHEHPTQDFLIGKYDKVSDRFIHYEERKDILRKIQVTGYNVCDDCFAKYMCAGGCPLRNKRETGSLQRIDEWICTVKKHLVHDAILRIEKGISKKQVPVIFGESIFESLISDNPSIKGV